MAMDEFNARQAEVLAAHPQWSYPDPPPADTASGYMIHLYGQAMLERLESIALAMEAIAYPKSDAADQRSERAVRDGA